MDRNTSVDVEGIRARHVNACPKPTVNPAWANAEHDLGALLKAYDALSSQVSSYRRRMDEIRELAVRNRSSLTPSRADLERIAVIAEGQDGLPL